VTKHEREGVYAMVFKTLGCRLYYFQVGKDIYRLLTGGTKNTKEEHKRRTNTRHQQSRSPQTLP
jgi:putative component of toxin-antitoxin plasmid stabilization module